MTRPSARLENGNPTFDDEGEECERPFCPFFHPFSRASNSLVKVKEEIQDDDIIVVYEKLIPSRSAFPSSATKSRVVSNTVEATQWSRPVIKRVRALKKLQLESLQVETQFYQKVYELEKVWSFSKFFS
ncbi:unnamed protein product [Meloidogyne enterolobii]|uniref:Uncharacterized protein n=1 Tax=Meloidogyne enterolobii TaxID=390850 RepID=A0ACB1ATR9_MELEN